MNYTPVDRAGNERVRSIAADSTGFCEPTSKVLDGRIEGEASMLGIATQDVIEAFAMLKLRTVRDGA